MLKSLELFGFKSFADRTKFDFAPGITGVVGPNGSGKSNVVDAIKWILGDQSAKSLRGKEMADVIFNGAAGRKASGFSEATLTFDNTQQFLPLETQEVHVGRRLYRNGDSEYLINRTPARLKDVRELFMGTGAGASAYCIIEQGRVDQILQANATNRRQVFEEAAGISRYKSRKNEALRKLERVDQNLLRLTDIVDEVEAQRNSLRSQATKAAKFRELSTELGQWWQGLAADDFRHLSSRQQEIEQQLEEFADEQQQLAEQQQGVEERLEAVDHEISAVDDRLRAVERQAAASREQMAGHQSTIRHQTARQAELEGELDRLRAQRLHMQGRAREAAEELKHNKRVLERSEAEFIQREAALNAESAEVDALAEAIQNNRQQIEQQRQQLLGRMQAVSTSASQVTATEAELDSLTESQRLTEQRHAELEGRLADCQMRCQEQQQLLADAEEQLAEVSQLSGDMQQRRRQFAEQKDAIQRTLTELRDRRASLQARKGVLEDLEARQEGLGIGVKEILNRAETSHYPPWNSILGSVADLIEVDLEHSALLELALGGRTQLIVSDDFPAITDYLNGEPCRISGRVGFVSFRNEKAPAADRSSLPDLSEQDGIVDRADRLVRDAEDVDGLAKHLLSDTWIVETLDAALKLAGGAGRGCRFVTLQGELLADDGTLFVGTVSCESALVSRKSELRRLKQDLFRVDQKIADAEHELAEVDAALEQLDDSLQSTDSKVETLATLVNERRADAADLLREEARLERDRDELAAKLEKSARQLSDARAALERFQLETAQAEEDLRDAQTKIETAERELAQQEHRLQTHEQKQSAGRLDLAKQEERVQALRQTHERTVQELTQRTEQRDEAERRLESSEQKRRQIVLHVLNASAELAEMHLTQQSFATDVAAIAKVKQSLRDQRSGIQKDASAIRRAKNELSDRQHQAEIDARDIRHQLASLEERIAEEYQTPLAEVADSGASAFELYLQEREATLSRDEYKRAAADDTTDSTETEQQQSEEMTATDDDIEAATEFEDENGEEQRFEEEIRFEDVREELERRVNRLRRKLKSLGNVNTDSLDDLDELERRYSHLKSQLDDLVEAKTSLEEIVRRINVESKRLFAETYDSIRGYFQELFRKLFGGGEGDVVLEDPEDMLECGIDIVARPPGKELRSISLLSGGEKTMTAVALLLAIFKSRPSPFCILDECDAALDEANVDRFIGILKEFQHSTQFILVTHRKPTMTVCDVLYGVTMEQSGVSKRMSVRFEDVNENGEFAAADAGIDDSTDSSPQDLSEAA